MIKKALIFFVFTFTAFVINAQNTGKPEVISVKAPGDTTVLFTVKTVTYNGLYGPRHVLAIWITNSSNQYVTTLKLNGSLNGTLHDQYRNKLFKWKTYVPSLATPPVTADCISGASLTAHTTHTVKWNGKDAAGVIVPDGIYTMWVEVNETNLSGNPVTSIQFEKGTVDQHLTPANISCFQNLDLKYFARLDAEIESFIGNTAVSISPNPTSEASNIELLLTKTSSVQISIFSITGKLVHRFNKNNYSEGKHVFLWNPKESGVASGSYFVHVSVDNRNQIFKLIIK
jgi:hypothetical protein